VVNNHSQPHTTERQLPGVACGETKNTELADWTLVQKCKDPLEAVILCVQLSSQSREAIAQALGMDPGNFARMMQGRANFPLRKRIKLMEVCGNYAPLQFDAWACNFQLVDKNLLKAIQQQAA
jgi:hypothetical protein